MDRLIGIPDLKARARIDLDACRFTKEPYPHTLLWGIGGLGKTSFARAIAEELGYLFIEKEAASLRHRKDIVEFLIESDKKARMAKKRLLMFIDECHRLTVRQQEVFYFPMTELRFDQGDHHWYHMSVFTLFMATTQMDRLDQNSFVTRFNNVWELRPHHSLVMERVLQQMFIDLKIEVNYRYLQRLAAICQGIPRTAWNLAQKLRRHALAHHRSHLVDADIDNVLRLEVYSNIG